jgi:coenzyme F420 hydrogenase subunit beta
MKTFFNLVQEVQKPGRCHRCGGCVAFCTAINFGALELDEDGKPRYKDMEKCIECGICYEMCPEIEALEEEIRRKTAWSAPIGRVIETTVAKAKDAVIRQNATDGGVVTAILLNLFEMGRIDGAIVTRQTSFLQREPMVAETREDIINSAGFHFDTSHGTALFSEKYSTFSPSILAFEPMVKKGLRRVAFVGTPCQIEAVRKMESMGVVPSDSIKYHFGLFCTGNFVFGRKQQEMLAEKGGFKWSEVAKINVKDSFYVHLKSGPIIEIPLSELDFMKRYACRFCGDYAAEFADISFGGIGAAEGWTTVITRSPVGRAVFADAREKSLDVFMYEDDPKFATKALEKVIAASMGKKSMAAGHRNQMTRTVNVKE